MIKVKALAHISVVVDDIERAKDFYKRFLGAQAQLKFSRIHNSGFARGAGFLEDSETLEFSICHLAIPAENPVALELIQYHDPVGEYIDYKKKSNDRNVVGHLALTVENISEAFAHVQQVEGVRLISDSAQYQPQKVSPVDPGTLTLFDSDIENEQLEKQGICDYVGTAQFFYGVDCYGIQWEFEGHF